MFLGDFLFYTIRKQVIVPISDKKKPLSKRMRYSYVVTFKGLASTATLGPSLHSKYLGINRVKDLINVLDDQMLFLHGWTIYAHHCLLCFLFRLPLILPSYFLKSFVVRFLIRSLYEYDCVSDKKNR